MGSWGLNAFENDTALDFDITIGKLENNEIIAYIHDIFNKVLERETEDFELDEAIACLEIVALNQGKTGDDFNKSLTSYKVAKTLSFTKEIKTTAILAGEKILSHIYMDTWHEKESKVNAIKQSLIYIKNKKSVEKPPKKENLAKKLYKSYRNQFPLESEWKELSKEEKLDWKKIVKDFNN